jgi:hypothetical protein
MGMHKKIFIPILTQLTPSRFINISPIDANLPLIWINRGSSTTKTKKKSYVVVSMTTGHHLFRTFYTDEILSSVFI